MSYEANGICPITGKMKYRKTDNDFSLEIEEVDEFDLGDEIDFFGDADPAEFSITKEDEDEEFTANEEFEEIDEDYENADFRDNQNEYFKIATILFFSLHAFIWGSHILFLMFAPELAPEQESRVIIFTMVSVVIYALTVAQIQWNIVVQLFVYKYSGAWRNHKHIHIVGLFFIVFVAVYWLVKLNFKGFDKASN